MINIFCTLKLSKLLNLEKSIAVKSDFNQDWNAHLFSVAGKKWIIFVHKQTLFAVVLTDVVKKDLSNLSVLFTEKLISQLSKENILTNNFENYLREHDQVANICTTDNDRKTMGSLNDFIFHIRFSYESEKSVEKAQTYVLRYLNTMPSKVLKYDTPRASMQKLITKFG